MADSTLHVQHPRGTVAFHVVPRFTRGDNDDQQGGLIAPMPGIVTDVRVDVGQMVGVGETLVVMEAMKMEHLINSPHAGIVTDVLVVTGQQVERGASLVVLDASDGS